MAAVYVFDRAPGSPYHLPHYGGAAATLHETHCGLSAGAVIAMSEHWARHTQLVPCPACFAAREARVEAAP